MLYRCMYVLKTKHGITKKTCLFLITNCANFAWKMILNDDEIKHGNAQQNNSNATNDNTLKGNDYCINKTVFNVHNNLLLNECGLCHPLIELIIILD